TDTATTEIYTLSLHDALPISVSSDAAPRMLTSALTTVAVLATAWVGSLSSTSWSTIAPPSAVAYSPVSAVSKGIDRIARTRPCRSEEHTSELQSRENLVCRLL